MSSNSRGSKPSPRIGRTNPPGSAAVSTAAQAALDSYREFIVKQIDILKGLDPANDADFSMAFVILQRLNRPQRQLAVDVSTSPATLARWIAGSKLPDRPPVRRAYVDAVIEVMSEAVDNLPTRPGATPPAGRRKMMAPV